MKGITAEIMARIDLQAQEDYGISQAVLMENAGRSAAEVILADLPQVRGAKIAIFCGKGNNGGDGFVLGRYLANESLERLTVFVMDADNVRQGAAYDNFKIIQKMGIEIRPMKDFLLGENPSGDFTVGVDSIFGTGFRGELPEECAAVARLLNSYGIRLYAIDVPSGLDATTGTVSKDCFRAFKTVTFGLPKQGFYVKDGPAVCGEIIVKDIGFPRALLQPYL
ncbi:MAG: NAD(P)H-hydrate epimerase [Candidatus Omnitrophota bacterium]